MKQKLLDFAGAAGAIVYLSFGMVPPAHADTVYDWEFTGIIYYNSGFATGITGAGTLTTSGTPTPYFPDSKIMGYPVISIAGTWGSPLRPISAKPIPVNGYHSNNNLLFPGPAGDLNAGSFPTLLNPNLPKSFSLLSFGGLAFTYTIPSDPNTINKVELGTNGDTYQYVVKKIYYTGFDSTLPNAYIGGTFKISTHGAPAPIAGAGLPFLAIGYGAYWLVKRRRRASDGPKAIKILPLTG